ncbi:MAG: nucleotidyltransferase family protein [Desulfobacteria bacterium]
MDSISTITAAILAGGLGTRLRAEVPDLPKVLAQICGRPFLFHLLDWLGDAGVRDVVLCTGYRGQQVREAVGDTYGEMRVRYSEEVEPMGTGGALRSALPLFSSRTVLVANGDSFPRVNLPSFLDWHVQRRSQASLVLARVRDASRFGRVEIDDAGRILRFAEKDGGHATGWINAGVYLFSRERIASVSEGRAFSLEKEIFPGWIEQGSYAMKTDGGFIDIGTPESYREAGAFFNAMTT